MKCKKRIMKIEYFEMENELVFFGLLKAENIPKLKTLQTDVRNYSVWRVFI